MKTERITGIVGLVVFAIVIGLLVYTIWLDQHCKTWDYQPVLKPEVTDCHHYGDYSTTCTTTPAHEEMEKVCVEYK